MDSNRHLAQQDDHKLEESLFPLVYGLDVTSIALRLLREDDYYFFKAFGEVEDMYQALLFTQRTILMNIRDKGVEAITADRIRVWLNVTHKIVACTLAQRFKDKFRKDEYLPIFIPGEYTKNFIWRWKVCGDFISRLCRVQSKLEDLSLLLDSNHRYQFTTLLCKNNDLEIEVANQFLILLGNMVKVKIDIPEYYLDLSREFLPDTGFLSIDFVLLKLALCYHADRLSDEEKQCVDTILIMGTPPPLLLKAMRRYTKGLSEQWTLALTASQSEDENRFEKVIPLLSYAFCELVRICPYNDASVNERIATILINVIARSLGYPNLVLCNPGEDEDKASFYYKVMQLIHTDVDPLREHIKNRLQLSVEDKSYKDNRRASTVSFILQLCRLFEKYEKQYGFDYVSCYFSQHVTVKALKNAMKADTKELRVSREEALIHAVGICANRCINDIAQGGLKVNFALMNVRFIELSFDSLDQFQKQLEDVLKNPDDLTKIMWRLYSKRYAAFMAAANERNDTLGEAYKQYLLVEVQPKLTEAREHAYIRQEELRQCNLSVPGFN